MQSQVFLYTEFFIILATVISGAVAIFAWGRRLIPGAGSIAFLMLISIAYSTTYALQIFSPSLPEAIFWFNLSISSAYAVPSIWLYFSLRITGKDKWLQRWNWVWLAVIPTLFCLLIWTNNWHHLMFDHFSVEFSTPFTILKISPGLFWTGYIYIYLILFIGALIVIWEPIKKHKKLSQISWLTLGIITPCITFILYRVNVTILDFTPFSLWFTGLTWWIDIFSIGHQGNDPMARAAVFDKIRSGVLVLDKHDHVVDFNPAALFILQKSYQGMLGKPVSQLIPGIASSNNGGNMLRQQIAIGEPQALRHFDLDSVTFYGINEQPGGKIILLQDTTDHIQLQEELKSERDRLDLVTRSIGAGLAILSRDGIFLWANDVIKEKFGDALGSPCDKVYGHNIDLCDQCGMRKVLEPGVGESAFDQASVDKNGKPIWLHFIASPVLDENGQVLSIIQLAVPITERKVIEEALRISEQRLSLHIQQTPLGVVEWDQNYTLTGWNPAAEKIFGYSYEEAMGKKITDLLVPSGSLQEVNLLINDIFSSTGKSHNINEIINKDKRIIKCEWFNTPLVDQQGKRIGIASMVQDITERTRNEKIQNALYRISETAYSTQNLLELYASVHQIIGELTSAKNFYISLYDKPSNTLSFPYYVDEYDEGSGNFPLGKGLTEYVLRSGCPLFCDPQKFKELQDAGEVQRVGSPSVDWLGVPLKTAQGKTFGVMVVQIYAEGTRYTETDLDILTYVSTQVSMAIERKRAEKLLRENEQQMRSLVENQGEGLIIADVDDKLVFANPAAEIIFGVQPGTLVGRSLLDFLEPEQIEKVKLGTEKRKKGEKSAYELDIIRPDDERHNLLVTATPQFDDQGKFIGTFGVFRDITDRKRMENELIYKSNHDSLTGLFNRAYFENELGRMQLNTVQNASVLMADVDGLKNINDRLGHAAGDEFLRNTARILVRCFRLVDIVARIGGDEFAVILPGIDAKTAPEMLHRLEDHLAEFNAAHSDLPINFSIGIATASANVPLQEVLKQADQQMYRSKLLKKKTQA